MNKIVESNDLYKSKYYYFLIAHHIFIFLV